MLVRSRVRSAVSGLDPVSNISMQFAPFLSSASLSAPLSNSALTGLVDFNSATDFIAKCNGVYP